MIKIDALSFSYPDSIILDGFSCYLKRGERINISGPSGKGKTTLLRIIAGLEKNYKGKVEILHGSRISMVFQEDVLLPWYTALENAASVGDRDKAERWLKDFGLGDALNKLPSELSGGMKRRVALARAMVYGGDILILDEAFKGIDEKTKNEIIALIIEEYKDRLIIFTSHDKQEALTLATRTIEL